MNVISEFEFIAEVGFSGASVKEIFGRVFSGDVGKPQLAFRIHSESGRVDGFEPSLTFEHPIDRRVGPTVGRIAVDPERSALFHRQRFGRFIFKVVQLRFPHKDRVGRGHTPLVFGETLVLT